MSVTAAVNYLEDDSEWVQFQKQEHMIAAHCDILENISPRLAKFLNVPNDFPVNREKVIFKICRYIQANHLEREGDQFMKDDKLRLLFPGCIVETYSNLLCLLDKHFQHLERSRSSPALVQLAKSQT